VAEIVPTVDELSDNEVAILYNHLFSEITIPVRIAIHVTNLQKWVKRLVSARNLDKEPKENKLPQ